MVKHTHTHLAKLVYNIVYIWYKFMLQVYYYFIKFNSTQIQVEDKK